MSATVICKVGFRKYMFSADWELARARALYDTVSARTGEEYDDYEVQEFFEDAWVGETGEELVYAP